MTKKATAKSKSSKIRIPRISFKDTPINVFLVFTLVIFAFLLGMLVNKVMYLDQASELTSKQTQLAAQLAAQSAKPAAPAVDNSPKQVSVDDDPVLGDKNAKVTLIEFSDYECPFCKRYFDQSYSQIKKEYIDTGKVKLVFRDLPLPFHQNAPKEAQAANCAREQGGDEIYYKYHDEMFKKTTSNGTGLALDQLSVIATDLGLDGAALQTCLDSDKYQSEITKDIADAKQVGATGTPTFFIGKSTSTGVIAGTRLVGAQPYSTFKSALDLALK